MNRRIAAVIACLALPSAALAQDPAKKDAPVKFSGYIQGRFSWLENSDQGLDARGSPLVRDGFSVRRGRLKATADFEWTRFVLQIDAVPRGVTLKDAEVHLIEPWTGHGISLVLGQMKWPFGFEVLQSSSDREFPERSRVVRSFAAGERDRGAKIVARVGVLSIQGGVFDGNGTDNGAFFGVDNDQNKDVIGRLGVDLEWLSGGVSGWWGRTYRPAAFDDEGTQTVSGATFDRNRIGADAQIQINPLPLGATILRAELIAGRTWFRSGAEQFGVPAIGWYATLVQRLGSTGVAIRYDRFDPLAGTEDLASPTGAPASTNAVGTLGFALLHDFGKHLRATAAWEMPMTAGPTGTVDPKDSGLTLQLQAKF